MKLSVDAGMGTTLRRLNLQHLSIGPFHREQSEDARSATEQKRTSGSVPSVQPLATSVTQLKDRLGGRYSNDRLTAILRNFIMQPWSERLVA